MTTSVIGIDSANTCATHLGITGMARMQSTLKVAILVRTMTKVVRPMIHKIADLTNIQHVVIAQRKYVQHLESINEFRAAAWIRDTWWWWSIPSCVFPKPQRKVSLISH